MRHRSSLLLTIAALAIVSFGCAAALHVSNAPAQRHYRPAKRGMVVFVGGYFYDPFFGPYPWWSRASYPYPYFPTFDERAEVRVLVTPKEAAVYVDGYYAGIVDDFDGFFQRLPLPPGPHEIDLFLPGYRIVHQRIYLTPRSTFSLRDELVPLVPGEMSEPPRVAPPLPTPPPGSARLPRTPPPVPTIAAGAPTGFGTLSIRVQPPDADVFIDGELWTTSAPGERLMIDLPAGVHRVEIEKTGYRPFSSDIEMRAGETRSLNVSLSTESRE